MNLRSRSALAIATALLLSAASLTTAIPATAAVSGGTILFVRNYNIWIANGDGSSQRAVTTDGTYQRAYTSPTQSDAGIIAAGIGPEIVRMNQQGVVLNRMDPPPLTNTVGHLIDGTVVEANISPDGSKIAYTYTSYECENGCMGRSATSYTRADVLVPPTTWGQTNFDRISWVGNATTLQTGGYGSHVMIHTLGTAPTHWFDDSDYASPSTDLANTELSRDGRWVVGVRGYAETSSIIWFRTAGAAPAVPDPLCVVGPASGITNPTFSPDSATIAWQEADGIYSKVDPSECTTPSVKIIADASQPHWSPAGMQAAGPVATPPAPPAPAAKKLVNTKKPSISGTVKVGKKLTVRAGSWKYKAKFTYRWYLNGKAIKKATHRTLVVKKSYAGKKLTVKVTAQRSGYATTSATSKAIKVRKR